MPKTLGLERLGEISYNTHGSKMEIIRYESSTKITIKFEDEYITNSSYKEFKKGAVRNPNDISVFEIGYIGEGIYSSKINKLKTKCYNTWNSMLTRCYSNLYQENHPTYKDCFVSEEWHNFQNFAKWYDENIYQAKDQQMQLDKDILFKRNKIYSSETCVFVPKRINSLFIKDNSKRGEYPIGVSYNPLTNRFTSYCSIGHGKTKTLGYSNTSYIAYTIYKTFKENLIKQIAEEYKKYIPKKLYESMYLYQVEITD